MKKICTQERETRCLKFRGFDVTSKCSYKIKANQVLLMQIILRFSLSDGSCHAQEVFYTHRLFVLFAQQKLFRHDL